MDLPSRFAVTPPERVCILRLSAIGDVCHTLPVVRTLQAHWPETRLTWVIGATEAALVGDIPGIEFITFDKRLGRRAYADLWRRLRGRRFDLLLQMQAALRASVAAFGIRATVRLGFDRARARDLQWLFTNARIEPRAQQHVMDGLFGFAEKLGIDRRVLRWDIPQPAEAVSRIAQLVPDSRPFLIISPCSSDRRRNWRNWAAERYAAVADHACGHHGLQVVLTGGPSDQERIMGEAIMTHSHHAPVNLIGQSNLKELLVLIDRSVAVVAPDSGPLHIATTVDTPVIGLYATSNPDRTGPYRSREWVVNHYPDALAAAGHSVDAVRWGTRVRDPDAMLRIGVAEVTARLDALMASRAGN